MKQPRYVFNHYLGDYHYYHRDIALINKPQVYAIELTNFCNLTCLMCPRKFMKREIGFMDFDLFRNIIKQIKGYTDFVWLHFLGESLFHPQLERFIDYCSENNIKAGLSTNATILDNEKALMLLNSKLDRITLSLDGSKKETYEKIRENSDWDTTYNNIINFLKLKKKINKKNPITQVQIIRMEETKDELDTFKKQWENLADEVLISGFYTWGNLLGEIVVKMEKQERLIRLYRKGRYPCMVFWKRGVIHWNGDFVPCCADFDAIMVLGNCRKQKLEDIWNSVAIKREREEQSKDNYNSPLCKNCVEWCGAKKDIFYPFSRIFKKLIFLGRDLESAIKRRI